MAKGAREKIKLESSAGTGHFYTTSKNKRTMTQKMEIKKFDPKARKHVMYKEAKIQFKWNQSQAEAAIKPLLKRNTKKHRIHENQLLIEIRYIF